VKILYDGLIYAVQPAGGVSRYVTNLVGNLPSSYEPMLTLVGGGRANVTLPVHPRLRLVVRREIRPRLLGRPLAARAFVRARRKLRPDVVHPSYYSLLTGESVAALDQPVVITVYDMIHERFQRELDPDGWTARTKRAAVGRADAVICISENTKADLMEICGVSAERITVIPPASELEAPVAPAPDRGPTYFLYVGSREHSYKNFDRLLRAMQAVREHASEVELALAGPPLQAAERGRISELGLADAVRVHAWVDDAGLARLYQASVALVYPSLYEGFGIPLLEAMRCGTAVIAGRVASIPEVVADAALLVDPTSSEALAGAMIELLESRTKRAQLLAAGASRAAKFSWAEAARRTVSVYEAIT
jgi:glycosyltransferase involved in cell wall biosynthesis